MIGLVAILIVAVGGFSSSQLTARFIAGCALCQLAGLLAKGILLVRFGRNRRRCGKSGGGSASRLGLRIGSGPRSRRRRRSRCCRERCCRGLGWRTRGRGSVAARLRACGLGHRLVESGLDPAASASNFFLHFPWRHVGGGLARLHLLRLCELCRFLGIKPFASRAAVALTLRAAAAGRASHCAARRRDKSAWLGCG